MGGAISGNVYSLGGDVDTCLMYMSIPSLYTKLDSTALTLFSLYIILFSGVYTSSPIEPMLPHTLKFLPGYSVLSFSTHSAVLFYNYDFSITT